MLESGIDLSTPAGWLPLVLSSRWLHEPDGVDAPTVVMDATGVRSG